MTAIKSNSLLNSVKLRWQHTHVWRLAVFTNLFDGSERCGDCRTESAQKLGSTPSAVNMSADDPWQMCYKYPPFSLLLWVTLHQLFKDPRVSQDFSIVDSLRTVGDDSNYNQPTSWVCVRVGANASQWIWLPCSCPKIHYHQQHTSKQHTLTLCLGE